MSKKETKTSEGNGKVRIAPEDFVIAWQSSTTIDEVAVKLDMSRMSVRQRAYSYRRKGVPLKSMRSSVRRVDWEALRDLAFSTATPPQG